MKVQFDHKLNVSLFLWAEHVLLQGGGAFLNKTLPLYYTPDPTMPTGYLGYSSPFKQWVADSSVSGAWVANSVSGSASPFVLTRASGIRIDYDNGRVLVPSLMGKNLKLNISTAIKECNVYLPTETDDPLLTANKYFFNPRFNGTPTSGISPRAMVTPAIFVNTLSDSSTPFSFGGLDLTQTKFSFTVLAESDYQLKGILSLFRDTRYNYIPLLDIANDPFDSYGDLKGGTGYNYLSLVAQYGTPGNLIYIDNVYCSKMSDRTKINPLLFGGEIDLEVSFVRQPG